MTKLQVAALPLQQKQGRVWIQRTELNAYFPLSDAGMTGVNFPEAAQTVIRGQATTNRTGSNAIDVTDGDTDLAAFTIPTRVLEINNYLLGLAGEKVNVQLHTGQAGDPTQYNGANQGFAWVLARRGTGTVDILAIADNAGEGLPVGAEFPFVAVLGPLVVDWTVALARKTTVEAEAALGIFTLAERKSDDPARKTLVAQTGMIVHAAGAGVAANVYFFTDGMNSAPTVTPAAPIATIDVNVVSVAGYGDKLVNRFIVGIETQAAVAPQINYTNDLGTTWAGLVNIGAVNADEATVLHVINASRIYAAGGQAASSKLWTSADGAASWTEIDPGLAQPLRAIDVKPNGIGWIAGDSNVIARITNFDSVATITGPSGGAGDAILAVAIKGDTGTVFIGNDAGELYASQDDGQSWLTRTTSIQGFTATSINHISFDDTGQFGYMEISTASARRILRSTDGGNSWEAFSLGTGTVSNIAVNDMHVAGANAIVSAGAASGGTAVLLQALTNFDGGIQE